MKYFRILNTFEVLDIIETYEFISIFENNENTNFDIDIIDKIDKNEIIKYFEYYIQRIF